MKSVYNRKMRLIWINLLVGITYFALGKFGLSLASIHPSASVVWPPTGFALAMFLLHGNRLAPSIFLGAFFVNVTTEGSILTSVFIALGNMLEGLVGAMLTRPFIQEPYFSHANHVLRFAVLGGMGATLISATIGVGTLVLGGFASFENFSAIWASWWLGDIIGAIVITPLILLWSEKQKKFFNGQQLLEYAVLLALLTFAAIIVYHDFHPFTVRHLPVAYITIPFLIWAAIRFGPRETITASFVLAVIAVTGTLRGYGPFAVFPNDIALPLLQSFIGIVTGMGLSLAAALRGQSQYEDALIGSEQHFRTLVERSWDVIVLLDREGLIQSITPSVTAVLGYHPQELIGRNTFALLYPDDTSRMQTFLQELKEKPGASAIAEFQYRSHEGSWRWMEAVGTNLLEVPSIGALVINLRDITQRKREGVIQSHFLSLASHQLRTPITMVRWALESLEEMLSKELRPAQEENFSIARRAARRMEEAVNALLTLSQQSSGNVSLQITKIPLQVFLEELKRDLAKQWAEKGHIVTIHCSPASSIETDRAILQEIVTNLLNNACQYSPPHSRIILSAALSLNQLHISVKDEGPGIPEKDRDRIFSLFFRGMNAKQGHEGTGIGLYVAHELTRALNGKLTFTSNEGRGTTFTIALPILRHQNALRTAPDWSGFHAVPK